MLRVGFDLTGLELDSGGGARIARGMRRALADMPGVELVGLCQPGGGGRIRRGLARELWWYPVALPAQARGLDVLHCPLPLAPTRGNRAVVVTVHDALALDHPEWFTRANALHARTFLRVAARRAAVVHTSSEYSRRRLEAALGVARERIVVVPPGVDARFSSGHADPDVLRRLGVDGRPFLLAVGTLQPRKNLEAVIGAFELLAAELPHALVIAGARGWRDEALLQRIRASGRAARIAVLGRVSESELLALYRAADAFVFPSLGEGFGLPPLEAMACGTPVVSSDATSLPEVVGEAAVLVDARRPEAVAHGILRALGSADELTQAGLRHAAQFSWRGCAEALVDVYARAAAGS